MAAPRKASCARLLAPLAASIAESFRARRGLALGDKDRGFEWLTKAFDQRSGVRDDPRLKALVARLKLPN